MAASGGTSVDQFESYFQRADLDRDGRISGAEAVSFFRGSNLPQDVLAKIWTFADQNRVGFLSRPEFYNALKLVTVAQSKRELTPDIVKAALYGPASAKIPAPQISLAPVTTQQSNFVATSQVASAPSQNFGIRGQVPSGTSISQQFVAVPMNVPGSTNQYYGMAQPSSATMNSQYGQIKPPTNLMNPQFGQFPASSTGVNPHLGQARPNEIVNSQFRPVTSTIDMNQQFGYLQPSSTGVNQQFAGAPLSMTANQQFQSLGNQPVRSSVSMLTGSTPRPPLSAGDPIIPQANATVIPASNAGTITGPNPAVAFASNSGNQLSTHPSAATGMVGPGQKSTSDPNVSSASNFLAPKSSGQDSPSSTLATSAIPGTSSSYPSPKVDPFEALQSNFLKSSSGSNPLQTHYMPKLDHQQVQTQIASSPASLEGVAGTTLEPTQDSWPKMTRAGIQKYTKVFMEVDSGRIGRITGEQARKLFLSWRLPREVLKQVWDLSDQDSDSMLSLREFCIALYLMERYREGKALPSTLPQSVMLDEALMSLAGPPVSYGNTGWNAATGFRPPQVPGSQPVIPGSLRPQTLNTLSQQDISVQSNQTNARGISVDNFHKLGNGEENPLGFNGRDAEEIKKAEHDETMLLDSKEKLKYYQTKMQELVLYKSRCDNRLNEIMERARADKAEAEALEKKYQEKYKLVAEVHSKLTLEEASYREIQERKMELHQAIIRIEQGGSADGILQVRADRIQSDLEELSKVLSDRCNKHDLQMKSSTLIELPSGWTPGVPEAALVWDEEWDKFEDEGFSLDVAIPEKNSKHVSSNGENSSPARSFSPDSVLNADSTSEKPFSSLETAFGTEYVYGADDSKSVQDTAGSVTPHKSPSEGYTEGHITRNSVDADSHRSYDDSTWGNFNNDDDIDSAWAFSTKDFDDGKLEQKHFFGSNVFAASPERSDSPQGSTGFQKNGTFFFEESFPSSPLSRAANSPSRASVETKDPFFDSFSRYDTFSVQSSGSPPHGTNLTRFDSISSTSGFNHNSNYSFDDSDLFGSTGPFKVSSETPKKGSEWGSSPT